jgi:hypothetical protein
MAATQDLDRRIQALERRVQELEDLEALRRLKARYAERVDARYAGGVRPRPELETIAGEIAGLFTEDAVWDGGALGVCRGREEIRRRFLEPTLRFSWHYFVQPNLAVEGDRARGTWDLLAPCTLADGAPHWLAGVEEDEYRKVAGAWLHHRMTLRVVFLAPHATGWASGREGAAREPDARAR